MLCASYRVLCSLTWSDVSSPCVSWRVLHHLWRLACWPLQVLGLLRGLARGRQMALQPAPQRQRVARQLALQVRRPPQIAVRVRQRVPARIAEC